MTSHKVSPAIVSENINIQNQLKYLIYFEAVIGLNRLYLLGSSKLCSYCVTTLNFLLFLLATITYNIAGLFNTSQSIYKNTQLVEYSILCICAVFLQKSSLGHFFRSLNNVDALLKIDKDIVIVNAKSEYLIFLLVICVYNTLDFILSFKFIRHPSYNLWTFGVSYLTIVVNDVEVVFYCTLLRMILRRLAIIYAHLAKEYLELENIDELTKLTQRITPDVSSLHAVYEMLHYSSNMLEKIVGFPLLAMFTTCGIITIMMLRNVLNSQMTEGLPAEGIRYLWFFATIKCVKNGILLLIPCYNGTLLVRQARSIRYALKRGLAVTRSDIRKRRQLKAFHQLTRDNEFAYTLWGSIHLDMALPLSYYYICLTYFIITVQFAKFFD